MATGKSTLSSDERAADRGVGSNELDGGRVILGTPGTAETTGIGTPATGSSVTGIPSGSTGAVPSDASYISSGARILGGESESGNFEGPGPEVMAAGTLTGDEVVNPAGETLGKIESIMLDVRSGRIAYAVLSFGGFLGIGDKLFAVPWQALQLDAENKCFVLDVDKEMLDSAPGFDKDHWPSMADPQWAELVHSHYGSRPYWE
jgi:sporulation protein YlmC with PRC-barrel domain